MLTLVTILAAGLMSPPPLAPPAQVICVLGRQGQPSGCRVVRYQRPASPRLGRVAD